jgi:hypothetical protein|tara:strand:+ start:2329 stop:2670 length:342 start_codon:yes stop_codon:yes gene_type:complete
MSDTKTQATAPTAAPTAPAGAAAPATGGQVDLTVQDLNTLRTVIDVATQRGAFKANELQAVGTTYNKLDTFLQQVQKQQAEAQKAKEEAEGKKPAPISGADASAALSGEPTGE